MRTAEEIAREYNSSVWHNIAKSYKYERGPRPQLIDVIRQAQVEALEAALAAISQARGIEFAETLVRNLSEQVKGGAGES